MAENPLIYKTWQAPLKTQKIRPLLEDPDWTKAQRVLDLGCGPGTNASLFYGKSYVGVDCDAKMIKNARARYGDRFVVSDVTKGDFVKKGPFDLILVNSMLHHLDDVSTSSTLAYVQQSLSPEGRVYIFELVLPGHRGLPRFFANIDRGYYPRTFSKWTNLFRVYFHEECLKTYFLTFAGIRLYQMVFFKGTVGVSASRVK